MAIDAGVFDRSLNVLQILWFTTTSTTTSSYDGGYDFDHSNDDDFGGDSGDW